MLIKNHSNHKLERSTIQVENAALLHPLSLMEEMNFIWRVSARNHYRYPRCVNEEKHVRRWFRNMSHLKFNVYFITKAHRGMQFSKWIYKCLKINNASAKALYFTGGMSERILKERFESTKCGVKLLAVWSYESVILLSEIPILQRR